MILKRLVIIFLIALFCVSCDYQKIYDNCTNKLHKLILTPPIEHNFGRISTTKIDDNTTIDASNVSWSLENDGNWPIVIDTDTLNSRENICLFSAHVSSNYPDAITPSWDQLWHHTTAIQIWSENASVVNAIVSNVGDGIDFNGVLAKNWIISSTFIKDAHDDCIENDQKNSGVIESSLLDGCYVAFSARGTGPSNSTFTISNSLVRLKSFNAVYNPSKYPSPGHGGFFKWDIGSPKVNIVNSIFRVDSLPIHGDLEIPNGTCSNNTLVWLGKESISTLPQSLRDCFAITNDISVWYNAVDEWHNIHYI